MMHILLTGRIMDDVQTATDRNGHEYLRFRVMCKESDSTGNSCIMVYSCTSYLSSGRSLKANDIVTLAGRFSIRTDPTSNLYDCRVHVQTLDRISV